MLLWGYAKRGWAERMWKLVRLGDSLAARAREAGGPHDSETLGRVCSTQRRGT